MRDEDQSDLQQPCISISWQPAAPSAPYPWSNLSKDPSVSSTRLCHFIYAPAPLPPEEGGDTSSLGDPTGCMTSPLWPKLPCRQGYYFVLTGKTLQDLEETGSHHGVRPQANATLCQISRVFVLPMP